MQSRVTPKHCWERNFSILRFKCRLLCVTNDCALYEIPTPRATPRLEGRSFPSWQRDILMQQGNGNYAAVHYYYRAHLYIWPEIIPLLSLGWCVVYMNA